MARSTTILEQHLESPVRAALRILSFDPVIVTLDDFLTDAECSHLIGKARPHLAPSSVLRAQRAIRSTVRTSSNAWLRPDADPLTHTIARRIAAFLREPLTQAEGLQIARYVAGQHFALHYDVPSDTALPGDTTVHRRVSVLVYLTSGVVGGETHFPECSIAVPPVRGRILIWQNFRPHTRQPHPGAAHEGRPVIRGEKWVMTMWFPRAHLVDSDRQTRRSRKQ
jgi:prolyl 4-hydroxylase